MAQATQPLQASPPETQNKPAESKPGGERPTTPAPEPARPDAEAQKAGAQPALPPAPAEKTAAPIQEKVAASDAVLMPLPLLQSRLRHLAAP